MSSTILPSVSLSKSIEDSLAHVAKDYALQCLTHCASKYGFNLQEAIEELGIDMITTQVERLVPRPRSTKATSSTSSLERAPKKKAIKPTFPLPYDGRRRETLCDALTYNYGLMTQCPGVRKGESLYCSSCTKKAGTDAPEYGTIHDRLLAGIMDYKDPKGRTPVPYAKIMERFSLTEDQVQEEATKFDVTIDPVHFQPAPAVATKKRVKKVAKEEAVAPKKTKKRSLEVDVEEKDVEELFSDVVSPPAKVTSSSSSSSSSSSQVREKKPKVIPVPPTIVHKKDLSPEDFKINYKKITLPDGRVFIRNKEKGNTVYDFDHYMNTDKQELLLVGHWNDAMDTVVLIDKNAGLLVFSDDEDDQLQEEAPEEI